MKRFTTGSYPVNIGFDSHYLLPLVKMKHPIVITSRSKIQKEHWEFIGSFPIRTELVILPNLLDSPKGWKIEKIESVGIFNKIKNLLGY